MALHHGDHHGTSPLAPSSTTLPQRVAVQPHDRLQPDRTGSCLRRGGNLARYGDSVHERHVADAAHPVECWQSRFGITFARSEAIKRNGRAVVCKSASGTSCTQSGGWEQGWIVFHDSNNNAAFEAGELLIQQQSALPDGLRLSGNQPVANYVSYSANGSAKLVSGAFQAGTITLCPIAGNQSEARKIVLSGTGRPRTYNGSAADCR